MAEPKGRTGISLHRESADSRRATDSRNAGIAFRDDFTIWENELEAGGAIAGSIESDKFIMIPAAERVPIVDAVNALRAGRDPFEIEEELHSKGWDLDVGSLVELLFHKMLIKKNGCYFRGSGSDRSARRTNDEINAFSKTLLSVRIRHPLLRPAQLQHVVGLLLSAVCVLVIADLVLFSLSAHAREIFQVMVLRTKGFGAAAWGANTAGVGILAMTGFVAHEIGHVLVARRYGLYLRSVQFRFYRIFQSYIAVQIPGLCTLPLRAQVEVALAGPLANLLFGLLLVLGAFSLPIPPAWLLVLLIGAAVSILAGISNLNPFFPTDGYRFLSVVLFRNPDVRAFVVARMQTSGFASLQLRHKIYLCTYVVSTLGLLAVSNYLLVSLVARLLGRIVPVAAVAVIAATAAAVVDFSVARRTIRFFKGKT